MSAYLCTDGQVQQREHWVDENEEASVVPSRGLQDAHPLHAAIATQAGMTLLCVGEILYI